MLNNPIIWIDLEMTGLCIETDQIVEIAVVLSDGELKQIIEGPNMVIHTSDEKLEQMGDWCKKTFLGSGLINQIRESKISVQEAEDNVISFLGEHVQPGIAPIAGNSVGTDKLFLQHYMPRVYNYLHYRVLDVSSIKLLSLYWFPNLPKMEKRLTHRAKDDILESIEELKYYREHIFRSATINDVSLF